MTQINKVVLDTIAEVAAFAPTGKKDEVEFGLNEVLAALSCDSGIPVDELNAEIGARKRALLRAIEASKITARGLK